MESIAFMSRIVRRRTVVAALSAVVLAAAVVSADAPGRGRTGAFEREYLEFIMDHHFSALRMTELAAGTDAVRDATISPAEGTSPSPEFASTPAKSMMDDLKSLARRNNRMQREEILAAGRMLRQWYGVTYQPRIRPEAQTMIAALERAAPGRDFDQTFMMLMSRHHFTAAQSSLDCLVARELMHNDLARYCRGIVEGQILDIDEMRHMLCRAFNACDFMPFDVTTASRG